jgi:hypothetical protein
LPAWVLSVPAATDYLFECHFSRAPSAPRTSGCA